MIKLNTWFSVTTIGRPENNVAKITTLRTESKLANEYGVAPRTIRNYAQKAKDFEELSKTKPELAQSIWSGEKSLKEVRKDEKKEEIKKVFLCNLPAWSRPG